MDWPAPLTVREVADQLGCSEDEVRGLIREGELSTVACGIRPGLVPRHVLDDYLRRHERRLGDPHRSSAVQMRAEQTAEKGGGLAEEGVLPPDAQDRLRADRRPSSRGTAASPRTAARRRT